MSRPALRPAASREAAPDGSAYAARRAGAAAGVVRRDLDDVTARLADDLARLAGCDVLVTGGGGFLGYYLVLSLLRWNRDREPERRIRVTIYDNWIRGLPGWVERRRSDELRVESFDLARPLPPDDTPYDYIVHAASIASPTYYRRHPIETMDANVNGLRSLLDRCVRQAEAGRPVRGLLFFSSSEIYGDPDPAHIPTSETYRGNVSCTGPRACYDESKRYGETLCVTFAAVHGVPTRIVRPFNNYGPGLRLGDRRVLPDFARDVLAGRDIVLHSSGTPTRTFCYVGDAVVGYYRALVRGRPGEAYNIGTEEPEISMRGLAELFGAIAREELGYRGGVVHRASDDPAYTVDSPTRRRPSIDKARAELGYEPAVTLEEGLRRSLLWYAGGEAA